MDKTTRNVLAVALAALGATQARADDIDANYALVRPGDTAFCLENGPYIEECRRVRYTYYILPNLKKELAQIDLMKRLRPDPQPDEADWTQVGPVGFLDGGTMIPNPLDPDRPWGPLGPLIREALVVENVITDGFAEPVGPVHEDYQAMLFDREAALEDVIMLKDGLADIVTRLEGQIEALQNQ